MAYAEPLRPIPHQPPLARTRVAAFGLLAILLARGHASAQIIAWVLGLAFGDLPDWLYYGIHILQIGPAVFLAAAVSLSPPD